MDHIFTFSPSSEALLQRCLQAARPQTEDNKWVKQFKLKHPNISCTDDNIITDGVNSDDEAMNSAPDPTEETYPMITTEIDDEFLESLETEPISRLDFIVEECLSNPKLIIKLAEKLSESTVEKICQHLFNESYTNLVFLKHFYELFFPTYLKRDFTWFSLDLLVKAEKSQPVLFKKLLQTLFKDLEIPNKVLHDFVLTLNETKKLEVMLSLTDTDLSAEEYSHHIFTIYTVYKAVEKTERIQNYILMNLITHGHQCCSNRNYGRLFLAYLQAQNNLGKSISDFAKVEKILEMHRTPFKKPCMTVFKDILAKSNS